MASTKPRLQSIVATLLAPLAKASGALLLGTATNARRFRTVPKPPPGGFFIPASFWPAGFLLPFAVPPFPDDTAKGDRRAVSSFDARALFFLEIHMERLIKFTAGEIRRVIRRYGPWAAGKREAISPDDGETARNFTAGDNTCITLYEEPNDDLYWLEIWPGFGASCYTVVLTEHQYDRIEDLLLHYGPKWFRQRPKRHPRRRQHGKR